MSDQIYSFFRVFSLPRVVILTNWHRPLPANFRIRRLSLAVKVRKTRDGWCDRCSSLALVSDPKSFTAISTTQHCPCSTCPSQYLSVLLLGISSPCPRSAAGLIEREPHPPTSPLTVLRWVSRTPHHGRSARLHRRYGHRRPFRGPSHD